MYIITLILYNNNGNLICNLVEKNVCVQWPYLIYLIISRNYIYDSYLINLIPLNHINKIFRNVFYVQLKYKIINEHVGYEILYALHKCYNIFN